MKEPPFVIKESGYAGFNFPIDIYLKNKDEPKKIQFMYDLTLQQSGFLKDRYIFQNPNDEFKKKLLKGGGIPIKDNVFYTNPDQESRSRDSFTEEKQQLLSKPKLSSDSVKKHKVKEHKDEVPHRTSSFENLFGMPIQKPPKVSPDPKKLEKIAQGPPPKSDKKEKERSAEKRSKHEHKEAKPDKIKNKEDKDRSRQDKIKSHSKEQDKMKEKPSKRPNDRAPSPEQVKKRCLSPIKKTPSTPPRSNSALSMKEEYKILKPNADSEIRKHKHESKSIEVKAEKETKEKKKKDKKSHDRDKDRKDRKESKKENQKIKESPVNKEPPKEIPKEIPKSREIPKETLKESAPVKDKPPKAEKVVNKFTIENLRKTPPAEIEDKQTHHKSKEKSDSERKHKHKKKDKKRDESREKHKESSKDRKLKHDKIRDIPTEKAEPVEQQRETPVLKERPAPELASPISLDTASQCSSKSGIAKTSQTNDDIISSHSDSESSVVNEEEEKPKLENLSPEPVKNNLSPEPEPEPDVETEPEPVVEAHLPQLKEKSKKHKDKSSKREEKRRKRKAAEEEDAESRTVPKTDPGAPSNSEPERGESSGSISTETKVQDNGVSSSLGEEPEPGDLSPDYMVQLRDLQQRIMKIKNNDDLERVVNLIAETGKYEVTTQTFDFDLCLLDRSTVQQLIQMVGC